MMTLSAPAAAGVPLRLSHPHPQVEKPKRPTDKTVSWATGEDLFKVRYFLGEDAPAMSGYVQYQPQAVKARNSHIRNTTVSVSAPDTPPGCGGVSVKFQPDHMALAAIFPQIPWRQPGAVRLDPTWHVMAGEASLEAGLQKQREDRTLEAFYPRPSSIPESPAEPMEAQEPYDDNNTPQIPLVPTEEEELPDESLCFLSDGSSGQVAGVQANRLADARPEKVEPYIPQYIGNNLPVPMREASNARKIPTWRDASIGSTRTSRPASPEDYFSNVLSSRPFPPDPIPDVHSNCKQSGIESDVEAATTAAYAALPNNSMIDNELLMDLLSNPSLVQALTSKLPLSITKNSKPDIPSSMNLNRVSRLPVEINQGQGMNGVVGCAKHRIKPPSTSYMSMPVGGQERNGSNSSQPYINAGVGGQEGNGSNSSQPYINAGDRFQRTQGSEDRLLTSLPGAVRNDQLFKDLTNCGRVGFRQLLGPLNGSDAPPGNGIMPQSFSNKSNSRGGAHTGVAAPRIGAVSSTSLSRRDEQYFKSLIIQYGNADDVDQGRAGIDEGCVGSKLGNICNTSDARTWSGREQLDPGRQPERKGREQRQGNERNGAGSGVKTAVPRAKSQKVCIYFKTSRGCRNGDNCAFVHVIGNAEKKTERLRSAPTQKVPYAKRLKLIG